MLWLYSKFYPVVFILATRQEECYEMICNLIKWGEGGLQYDSLTHKPFDEVLEINNQASRINKETKESIEKAK